MSATVGDPPHPPVRSAEKPPAASAPRECSDARQQRSLPSGFTVRPMARTDLRATAALHIAHLPKGLFPQLGARFLARWHESFIDSDFAWAHVVISPDRRPDEDGGDTTKTGDGGEVAAYLLMTTDPAAHLREMLARHGRALTRSGGWGLLRRPGLAIFFARSRARRYAKRFYHAWRTRRAPATKGGDSGEQAQVRLAVVDAIATASAYRGRGLAAILLDRAAEAASAAGADEIALVTDGPPPPGQGVGGRLAPADTDQGAVCFYERLGWQRVAERGRDGRWLVEFRRPLRQQGTDGPPPDEPADEPA